MMIWAPKLHRWVAQKHPIVTAKSVQILCRISHHRQNRPPAEKNENNGSAADEFAETSFDSPHANDADRDRGAVSGKLDAGRYRRETATDRPRR
jgi:hypothetical protein